MSSSDLTITPETPTPNRATRRAAGHRARKLGALGSGAILASGAAAAVLGMTAAPAGAAGLLVDDSGDAAANPADCAPVPVAGACSLRDAVAAANDGDVITFDPSISGISLTQGEIDIQDAITITGPGATALTVTQTTGDRIFYSSINGSVTISGLKLTGGNTNDRGGAIDFYCDGDTASLTLDDLTITGNHADTTGGGVSFYGCVDLTIRNSRITNNTTDGEGGGVYFYDSNTFTMTNSVVSENNADEGGGGVYIDSNTGTALVESSTIADNTAGGDGGGFYWSYTTGTIRNSTISGNHTSDDGGGLYLSGDAATPLTIDNSTFANNTADSNGGGIAVGSGDLNLVQTTISGNTADFDTDGNGIGDGLYLSPTGADSGSLEAPEPDVKPGQTRKPGKAANQGRVGAQDAGAVTATGTIISGNPGGHSDIGTDTSSGGTASLTASGSLFGTVGTGVTVNDTGGTRTGVTDPGLGALANNGGPTQTLALLGTSPALDTGPNPPPSFAGSEFDQRGPGYPRVVNGKIDVGAYEFQPIAIVPRFTG